MQTTGQTPQAPAAKPAAPPKPVPPPEYQSEKIDKLGVPELIELVKDSKATVFQKAKACQRLGPLGAKEAVPAMAALLNHPQLAYYARYGLEPIQDPSADSALRAALPKLKGTLLVGAINSLKVRRDANAVPVLAKLLHDADPEVAKASASALGSISGAAAAKVLENALGQTKGPVRMAVADGGLLCAEGLLAKGDRDQALALYAILTRTDIPKPVRLAAMHGTIAAETSLNRPR